MVTWFNVIYTFKDGFDSMPDYNEALKAANELTNNKRGKDTKIDDDARISILKDYLVSIKAIGQQNLTAFGKAIAFCQKSWDAIQKTLDVASAKVKGFQVSTDENFIPVYAYNLGSIYQYGAKALDNKTPMRDVKATTNEHTKKVIEAIVNFQNIKAPTLQDMVTLYYTICSDGESLKKVTLSDIRKNDKHITAAINELAALPYIVKKITDVKGYSDKMLTAFYSTILDTPLSTDKEFYDRLVKNNLNYIKVDDNKISDGISFISESFKNSEICVKSIGDKLRDKGLFANGPAKDFCVKMKQSKVKSEYLDLKGAILAVLGYMHPEEANDKIPSAELFTEDNAQENIKLINEQIAEIISEYANEIAEIQQNIHQFNSMMGGKVDLRNNAFHTNHYTLKEVSIFWKAFYDTIMYSISPDDYNNSFVYVAKTLQQSIPDECAFTYRKNNKDNTVVVINDKINGEKLKEFIILTAKSKNISEFYKSFIDANISPSGAMSVDNTLAFKVKVSTVALNFIKKFFMVQYNTKVDLNEKDGYYSAACNFIYRKDLNVNESLSEEFMMYGNRVIITEDLEDDKVSYFKKLGNIVKDNGKNIEQYINTMARYDDSDVTGPEEGSTENQINNIDSSTGADSSINIAADELNATVANYGK